MPQKSSNQANGKSSSKNKDDEDLSTILDAQQREDVTLLIANCTESMRKVLLDNFDATAGLNKSFLQEGMSEDEKMMFADVKGDVSHFDAERKLKEASEKDLATLKMKNLRKNSLKAYDEWRQQVLMRVGEVVNSKETAKSQLENESSESAQQTPRAPATVGKIVGVPSSSKPSPRLKFRDLFPPTKTPLTKLPMDKRAVILHATFLLLLSLEHYNAFSRVLMLNLTSSLKLPLTKFEQDEYTTAKGLLEAAKEMTAAEETRKRQEDSKDSRKWKVNMATAAGAAVVGIAGSMAAPLVAAGVSSVMGGLGLGATAAAGYLGSVAGSTLLVGSLFGAYGGRMTGQMMDQYAREVEDFEFLPVHSRNKTSEDQKEGAEQASAHDHKLRVTICVSGWLTEKEEVIKPWGVIGTGSEVFALKYELEVLLNLGHAMDGLLTSAAWSYAQRELVKRTIFADLMAAMWPVGLVKVARVIDNPFSVAKDRSQKAGEVLADALINRAQGERPVTLIGYSLGARLIYSCLQSLAKRKAFGLIENAVLIGAPTPSDTSDWRLMRSIVSGRLINVYSQNDYLLGFMYRTSSFQYGVAGLQAIQGLSGVENVDVSEDVDGHTRYRYLIGSILKKIGFEDIDMEAVEEEREALEKMLKQEKKQSLESQRKRLMRRKSTQGKESADAEAEHEASEMEKNVQEATEKSLVTRVIEYFYTPKVPNAADAEKAGKYASQAVQDPNQLRDVAKGTYGDLSASAQNYAQYVASMLPSMPGRGAATGGDASKAAGDAKEAVNGATGATQSYLEQAKSYIPDGSSLPSLPSWNKDESGKEASEPAAGTASGATETAKNAAQTGAKGVQAAGGIAKDVVGPTVDNTLNLQNNPAVQAGKDTAKKAPIIHQAGENVPGAKKAAQVTSDTVGTTLENTTGTVSKTLNTTAGKAGEAGIAVGKKTGLVKEEEKKGYLETAKGYVPSWGASTNKESSTQAGKDKIETTGRSRDTKNAGSDTMQAGQGYLTSAAGYIPGMGSGKSTKQKSDPTKQAKQTGKEAKSKADDATKEASKEASKSTDAVTKTATDVSKQTQGYLSSAAGYLPSMSKTKTEKKGEASGQAEKTATDAKKPVDDAGKKGEEAANAAKKTTENTVKSTQGYLSGATSYLPSLSRPKSTSQKPTEATKQADKAASNATAKKDEAAKKATSQANGVKSKAQDTTKAASETPQKATEQSSSYLGGWFSGRKKPPKLDSKQSGAQSAAQTPSRPELKKTASTALKSPQMEQTTSGMKSPKSPPKLDRMNSGIKSPTSGTKSPAAGGQKSPSGAKSPPKLARKGSSFQQPQTNLDAVASSLKSSAGTATEAPKAVAGGAQKAGQEVGKGVSDPKAAAADTSSKLFSNETTAKLGYGSGKFVEKGKQAAGYGGTGVENAVKEGGKKVEQGQKQASKAAKQGTDAAGSAVQTGQNAVGQGGTYLKGAGNFAWNSLPSVRGK